MGIVEAIGAAGEQEADGPFRSVPPEGATDPLDPGWTKRVRVGRAPPDRTPCASRTSALENTIRGYAEKLGMK